jgi:hypothetical protein
VISRADGGLEGVPEEPQDEILSDEELDARLVQYLDVARPVPGDGRPEDGARETAGDPEDAIAQLIGAASPEQLAELNEWVASRPTSSPRRRASGPPSSACRIGASRLAASSSPRAWTPGSRAGRRRRP